MFLFGKKKNMFGLNDKLEHSVLPALDYPFAKEFYDESDSRYRLVKTFENLIYETKKIKIYNCKITNIEFLKSGYNVFLYFYDLKSIFGQKFLPFSKENKEFTRLFYKALKESPIEELRGKELNRNGVFLEDFLSCAKSYALDNASQKLEAAIKSKYPIEFISIRDETIYLFFDNRQRLENFRKEEAINFKKFCHEIIKPSDVEHVLDPDKLIIRLDEYHNYTDIGGRNYFNGDAMYAGEIV